MAPIRRMSGIVFDAENLLRVPNGTQPVSALASPVKRALLWNMGSGAYTALPGSRPPTAAPPRPVVANRPCVHCTAFGNPVDPDVKISR